MKKNKKNVEQFNEDVRKTGSYAYTAERLSSKLANSRISRAIAEAFNFKGKRILDLGCGDGAYTLEFPAFGIKEILGIDPASAAIEAASANARKLDLEATVKFEVGNIYELNPYISTDRFDCIVIRGVLHHLPDAPAAILGLSQYRGTVMVLEPNGMNPAVKLLEKFSRYHIEHEERSFTARLIRTWLSSAGFQIQYSKVLNLVPFFCPDWMASTLRLAEPLVERIPGIRTITCGQTLIVAKK